MLPDTLAGKFESSLSVKFNQVVKILNIRSLSGGSINEAFLLETNAGKYFFKCNYASRYPGMFEKEAMGLQLLHEAKEIDVPKVIDYGTTGNHAYIILEYIDSISKRNDFWEAFGVALARLHKHSSYQFGLDHDNYIGSLYQWNNRHKDWITFFIEERLERQLKLAKDSGLFSSSLISQFNNLYNHLPDIFPVEPPSLIHGDLWSGNYIVGALGQAVIIDPAVYYGHREMDIGMSRLFGVFGNAFYNAYNQEYPMKEGWKERIDICNLYPLMVHVNLFGSGYVGSVQSIMMKF
ncbi:MAG: fructosamine kinase family protein [Bacteroidetes bacterium]|nr:fructosamine kinase family protein [Bacteroidota bacterium]